MSVIETLVDQCIFMDIKDLGHDGTLNTGIELVF
jgi:hypothetical protein